MLRKEKDISGSKYGSKNSSMMKVGDEDEDNYEEDEFEKHFQEEEIEEDYKLVDEEIYLNHHS